MSQNLIFGLLQAIIARFYKRLATIISDATKFYDSLYELEHEASSNQVLFELIECQNKSRISSLQELSRNFALDSNRDALLLNGNFNHSEDIQQLLSELLPVCNRHTRLFTVIYNPYFKSIFSFLSKLGIRNGKLPETFITRGDLQSLVKLCGFEIIQAAPTSIFPLNIFGIGRILDGILVSIPVIKNISPLYLATLRPIIKEKFFPSISIIIPARNEEGNIEAIVKRLPKFPARTEIIFVEGHSKDQTWHEIQRVLKISDTEQVTFKALQQSGYGKNDAVRLGFKHATADLIAILDADMSVPPESLLRFYQAFCEGHADFINGSRLLYPMQYQAMQTANFIGNLFFAKALSIILGVRITDSLCGTKLLTRRDYQRFLKWREDFGDFDPFGDFELLFPAALLQIGIINLPINYHARSYGKTNIKRFRDGISLLKMTLIALWRVKFR